MDLLPKVQRILPRSSFITRYKTFIRSQLDYSDVIDNQAWNCVFQCKLESIQHNVCWE